MSGAAALTDWRTGLGRGGAADGLRRRLLARAGVAVLTLAGAAAAAAAEPRTAILVGNAAYKADRLANPVNDARALAASLHELGFAATLVEDADKAAMDRLAETIAKGFAKDGIGLFYYAGHALQHKGRNYLLPVEFELARPEDLPKVALSADRILDAMAKAGIKVAVLILDACRDNPFGAADDALGPPGLAVLEQAKGETLVAYATSAGAVARDGTGPNSPYTAALVSALERPGATLEEVFREVRGRVREATDGLQLPWVSGSIETALVLRPKEQPAAVDAAPRPEPSPLPAAAAGEGVTLASVHWRTIDPSRDPSDFRAFLEVQGGSPFAPLARDRLAALEGQPGGARDPIPAVSPVVAAVNLPAAEGGVRGLVTDCDLVVSDDEDFARLADPTRWGLVNTRLALRACATDLARDPENPRLRFLLGRALEIARRFEEAEVFYRRAADGGYAAAMTNLANLYRVGRLKAPDEAEVPRLLYRAATLGSPRGRVNLGNLYLQGRGVPKDESQAFYWTRLAAGIGWQKAINALGNMYERGQGVPKNEAAALEQYRNAAQLGSSEAMNSLGRLHEEGRGVAQDLGLAVRWYERAVAEGDRYAPQKLGRLHLWGKGVKADPKRARELFELAAERGFLDAEADIAAMYEQGKGVRKDPERAYYHYTLASLGQNRKGEAEAQRLAASLPPAAVERARREVEAWRKRN